MGHDSFTLRGREHICAQTDDTTRGYIELDVHTFALTFHRSHLAFTACYHVDHFACELFRHVDGELFDRFAAHTVYLFVDYLRLTNLKFIAFATHGLNEHREMEYASSTYYPLIGAVVEGTHTQCKVLFKFFLQAFVDMTACAEFTFLAEERTIINSEKHAHRRFIDCYRRQRFGIFVIANGVTYLEFVKSYYRTNVPGVHMIDFHMAHTLESVQFFYLRFFL